MKNHLRVLQVDNVSQLHKMNLRSKTLSCRVLLFNVVDLYNLYCIMNFTAQFVFEMCKCVKYCMHCTLKTFSNNWKLRMAKCSLKENSGFQHQHTVCQNLPQGVTLKSFFRLCIWAPLAAVQTGNPHIIIKISVWHIHTYIHCTPNTRVNMLLSVLEWCITKALIRLLCKIGKKSQENLNRKW